MVEGAAELKVRRFETRKARSAGERRIESIWAKGEGDGTPMELDVNVRERQWCIGIASEREKRLPGCRSAAEVELVTFALLAMIVSVREPG